MKFIQEFLSKWYLPTILAIIAFAGIILNNNIDNFQTIDISSFETGKLVGLFGSLFFISLLVERFLEIFVQDPNMKEKDQMKSRTRSLTDPTAIEAAEQKMNDMKRKRRRPVTFFGFAIGLVIALFGVRILTNLAIDTNWSDVQTKYVNILDMVLTAGLIAGGSEGIHTLINIASSAINPIGAFSKDS